MVFSEIYGTGAKGSAREKIGSSTPESGTPSRILLSKVVNGWKPQEAMKTLQNIRIYKHSNRPKTKPTSDAVFIIPMFNYVHVCLYVGMCVRECSYSQRPEESMSFQN